MRGVMLDSPGAAANSALVLLHAHIVKGNMDGLRPGSQLFPVMIAFLDRQSRAAWSVELMITLFLTHRPYRVRTPKKRSARDMKTGDDTCDDGPEKLGVPGDVGTVAQ